MLSEASQRVIGTDRHQPVSQGATAQHPWPCNPAPVSTHSPGQAQPQPVPVAVVAPRASLGGPAATTRRGALRRVRRDAQVVERATMQILFTPSHSRHPGARQSATHAHLVAMVGHWWPLGQAEQLALRFPEAKKPGLLRQRSWGALGRARLESLLGSRAQPKQQHCLPPANQLWVSAQHEHQASGRPMRSPGAAVAAAGRGVEAGVALLAGGGAATVGVGAGGARLRQAQTGRQGEGWGWSSAMRGRFLQE